ncbi:T9SS type A sorting domain-containing protein [Mariniflexile sp.]|uniref:T9SS type A sorting domain-containing protein n=1 Tax=Mariniflexile sp. TaxID=1979402 RepID=UPI0040480D37
MKKKYAYKITLLFITLFCAFNFGFGQSIFDNLIEGTNPNTANPYTTGQSVNGNIAVSGIGRGSGITGFNANNRYNAQNWSNSFDSNDYFYFTITPNSGYKIDFTSFVYSGQASSTGPTNFAFRSSLDGFATNIGTPTDTGTTINLSASAYQNITGSITFRFYGWGGSSGSGTFSINDFTFNGTVTALQCPTTTTYTSLSGWSNGLPNSLTKSVIINDSYTTTPTTNITACSLTVNAGAILTVSNGTYVEVENDVNVSGEIYVDTQGAFVQKDNAGTFNLIGAGTSSVHKVTALKQKWYYYTYWSSPVVGETIENAFPNTDGDRRFSFNGANFLDQHSVGTTNGIPDDIDDDNNDWETAYGPDVMLPGIGYAATSGRLGIYPSTDSADFIGKFNTGDVPVGIAYNPLNTLFSWNFIGNPYPSAIDFEAFYTANSGVVEGLAYFWSQASPPLSSNPGNQLLNFSLNDYAIYSVGIGAGTKGGGPDTPTKYIPSGQGFFIPSKASGTATFTNTMRRADISSNSQFFKNTKTKSKTISLANANKLWVNLTSDNGVFGQILVGYVDGATNGLDGLTYDAPKVPSQVPATVYWLIKGSSKKFAIQGKAANSIHPDEIIKLGFKTTINVATLYTLSIDQLQGDFLTGNTVYLIDHLLNKVHDLSATNYAFTSAVGEFNDRFEIGFNAQALSTNDALLNNNSLKIVELQDDFVQFSTTNQLSIKAVYIYDLLGRQLYSFKGESKTEVYRLSHLKNSIYLAKVELSNGAIVTKKTVKK